MDIRGNGPSEAAVAQALSLSVTQLAEAQGGMQV